MSGPRKGPACCHVSVVVGCCRDCCSGASNDLTRGAVGQGCTQQPCLVCCFQRATCVTRMRTAQGFPRQKAGGWGVVRREGEGRQQGTGPPPHQQERKNERRSVWAATRKTICPSSSNVIPCEAGYFRAGRLAGRAKCSTLLKVLVGIPGNSAPGTTSFSFEVTPVTNERTTKRREKGQLRHATPPIWRGCTAVSLPFPLVPFRFLCGRLPHSASAQIA